MRTGSRSWTRTRSWSGGAAASLVSLDRLLQRGGSSAAAGLRRRPVHGYRGQRARGVGRRRPRARRPPTGRVRVARRPDARGTSAPCPPDRAGRRRVRHRAAAGRRRRPGRAIGRPQPGPDPALHGRLWGEPRGPGRRHQRALGRRPAVASLVGAPDDARGRRGLSEPGSAASRTSGSGSTDGVATSTTSPAPSRPARRPSPRAHDPTDHAPRQKDADMPPRTRKAQEPAAPSTLKELKDTLWKAADKLRGSMAAIQYKDVILGLVFLKYVSDAYDERRDAIDADLRSRGDGRRPDRDDHRRPRGVQRATASSSSRRARTGRTCRRTPRARRRRCRSRPRRSGQLIDEAMDAVMTANPTLSGTLPRLYNRDNVDQKRLGELIDLFNNARFCRQGEQRARDLLGEVYEYFLEQVRPRGGQARRRVLHAGQRRQGARRGARARPRPRLRPVLRLRRHVRPDREVHLRPRRRPQGRQHLRPGEQRAHLADGEDEPRHPRHREQGPAAPGGGTPSSSTTTRTSRWTS